MNIKDVVIRAAKTALQAFLAVFTAEAFANGIADAAELGTLALAGGVAALAAAFAVVHNALLAYASS